MMIDDTIALDPAIFRTYDIRGIVGQSLNEETVYLIGRAFGSLVREHGGHQIVLARDGRLSSPVFIVPLTQGFLASGCDVTDVGMVPTPLLYHAIHELGIPSGAMLTGSHNPGNYNGVKMVLNGVSLSEAQIKSLYHRIRDGRFIDGEGQRQMLAVVDDYIQMIISTMRLARPLKIVIDAGSGVTGDIAPRLFRALGCEVHELYCEIDGHFPHHHPDPSDPANLRDLMAEVARVNADVGLAFDGDGDRLGVVTNKGKIICSDRLLMLFAQSMLAVNPGAKVVFDVKCTNHLATLVRQAGGEPIMWKTGHSLIKAKVAETGALLAGEMSGHFFFKDRWHGFDDALYAGVRLLEILAQSTVDSDSVFAAIPDSVNTPELKLQVPDDKKFAVMQRLIDEAKFDNATDMTTIDGLRVNFSNGWGLVRPSNTTPYLIMRFEAADESALTEIQTLFRDWLLSINPEFALPF